MSRGQVIFLDNNATTPPLPEVASAVMEAMQRHWANPSSGYSSSENVRTRIESAREQVAALVGASPESVIFTSGGTEANNSAVFAALEAAPHARRRIITSAVEHASILSMLPTLEERGYEVITIGANRDGRVRLEPFLRAIDDTTALASLHWVNNETGVIQPIEPVLEKCRFAGAMSHVDASQAVGKIPVDFEGLGADFLTLTAHKFHGPKGIGALLSRIPLPQSPLLHGGSQERRLRPGTENTPGILGFGVAAGLRRERLPRATSHMSRLRDRFEDGLLRIYPEIRVNAGRSPRIGNTSNLMFPGIEGASLVNQLDLRGIECSQTSACTHARPEPSHVLTAMGLSEEEAYASIRFSFSELNTETEVDAALSAIDESYRQLKHTMSKLLG